ncbi:15690_t:CDS:2 [Acaulospora colombiana]|uniref:15690_t:CDS:1 n=1 Tax=Acaulospora colombiana TaxID=27376 RepID=A0ACA9KZL7_9GLOM|nr:15690_t:CDS:2 [Acaulospora colombiana]
MIIILRLERCRIFVAIILQFYNCGLSNVNLQSKVYAKIPDSSEDDVNLAVEAARVAFLEWSKTPRAVRSKIMYRAADILESRLKEFAEAEVRDQGKTIGFATNVDITRSVYNLRFFAGHILHMEEKASFMDGVSLNYVQRNPVGVAGLIAPEAGLPDGVVNMIFGTGRPIQHLRLIQMDDPFNKHLNICIQRIGATTGQALVSHPMVPLISFTGGTVTGKKINAAASTHLKKVCLELGGKNANIIFEDCDFEKAVETSIKSSFNNQGEICLCGSRIFVQSSIYSKFLDAFVPKASSLVVGDPNDPNTQVGALISKEHMEKVLGYIELAKSEGGVIECGGQRKPMEGEFSEGYFVEPTVITNVSPSSRVAQEEIFGPVVTVHPFETEEEVIKLANDSPYGLSCSVWTRDGSRQRRVAESIYVGTCWVNCWLVRDLRMPFGGMKQSGK